MIKRSAAVPLLTIICAVMLSVNPLSVLAEAVNGTVIAVTDGDTVIIAHEGIPEKVRLVDVDCPEKTQPFGRAAKKFLNELVYMRTVKMNRTGKDRYGRTLANVALEDGTSVNEELVRAGYAWVYRGRSKNPALKGIETEARHSKRGLWADPSAIAPWHYRKSQLGLTSRRNPANVSNQSGLINELLKERQPAKKKKQTQPAP